MSTSDDNVRQISPEAAGDDAAAPSSEIKNKEQGNGSGGPVTLFFILGLAVSLILGWVIAPELLYSQKKQPIDYNHLLHVAEVDDGCESCHFFREDGTFSGVPKLELCIDCHEEVQGEDPNEIKFVEEYVVKEREVPWLIYSKQPDCVFFSHAAHIKGANMDCVTCHGHIGESETSRVYEENRITGYSRDIWGKNIAGFKKNSWDRMKMDDCAECHQKEFTVQRTDVKTPINRLLDNFIAVSFPGMEAPAGIGDSVQTQRDACFVCHK